MARRAKFEPLLCICECGIKRVRALRTILCVFVYDNKIFGTF